MPKGFREVAPTASVITAYFTVCLQLVDRLLNEREQVACLICFANEPEQYQCVSPLEVFHKKSKHDPRNNSLPKETQRYVEMGGGGAPSG